MFIAKYKSAGTLAWAKPVCNTCTPLALYTDSVGNNYITGRFFDTATIGTNTLICQGKFDLFVTKLDSAGNVLWANRGGGPGRAPGFPPPIQDEDEGTAIGVDSMGNVYVGGFYFGRYGTTATFDTLSLHAPATSTIHGYYGFLAKYNPNGTIMWLKTLDYDRIDQEISKLVVSPAGNFYISGGFRGSIKFGPGTTPLNGAGSSYDAFLAAFDPNGTLRWARRIGGPDSEYRLKVAINAMEEPYVTGSFYGNQITIGTTTLTGSAQKATLYVAKYNINGNPVWAAQTTGSGSIGDADITLDVSGNPYVAAWFSGTVTVGQQVIISSNISNGSAAVMKWDAAGTPLWAITPQGMGSSVNIVSSPTNNDIYLSGAFRGSTTFGNYIVTSQNTAIFIAKLSSQPTGIKETTASDLSIYPNPAQRELHLNLPKALGTINARLTDATGKTVVSQNLPNAAETTLALPKLPLGIYLLTIQTEKQVYRRKVVIQ